MPDIREMEDIYCGNCNHIAEPTDHKPLSKCDRKCDKYNEELLYFDWFLRTEKCVIENGIVKERFRFEIRI